MASFTSKLPPWAVGVIAVAAVLAVGGIGFIVYRKVKGAKEAGERKEEVRDAKGDLQDLAKKGVMPSYTDSKYQGLANQLQEAFDGCGTSNSVVAKAFKELKNEADVLKLVQTYGVRTFDRCGLGTGDFTGTLSQAIINEMSDGERAEINAYMNKIGSSYTF